MKLTLTKSETRVVRLKALGFCEKQIADKLFNSINTIKTHVKRAMMKNSLKNGFELVARYAANHPNMFRNAIVVLFLSIQGFICVAENDIYLRKNVKSRVKIVKVRRVKN